MVVCLKPLKIEKKEEMKGRSGDEYSVIIRVLIRFYFDLSNTPHTQEEIWVGLKKERKKERKKEKERKRERSNAGCLVRKDRMSEM